MGIFASCCKPSATYEDLTPDPEVRRQQLVAAAEKRQAEQETRGIKNVDAVKRQQRLDEERRKREEVAAPTDGPLKWQME
ncbi:small VCP/p97-interacting protein isoform X2 [Belonocnema kinseyi]|uniref:small VCP/p97-interacting protein isoform X2 n=1 Tax=Belonocnema kinseyi TaxID=2817044 RepID=UPI00143DCFB6|nr:small VCP/p97-interacting protein isoform X2 [Belonocnema kinseyi]